MSFLHPGILIAGLIGVAIPIAIHFLMRRRRRPIEWGAMRFLLEAWRKQRRRLRLEQLLLLAARCLLVGLLGVALARPLLGGDALNAGGPTTLYLLIDTGIASSSDPDGDGSALARHKDSAADLISSLEEGRGDRVALVALGAPAESVVLPASGDLGAVTQAVRSLEPTDGATDLTGAIELVRETIELEEGERSDARVVLLSELLEGSADTERPVGSLGESPALFAVSEPRSTPVANTAVVDISPLRSVVVTGRPGSAVGTEQLRVSLRRTGPLAPDVSKVRVSIDTPNGSRPVGEREVRWERGESETEALVPVELSGVSPGSLASVFTVSIDRDAIVGDNRARTVVTIRERLRVGVIGTRRFGVRPPIDEFDAADWFRLALAPGDDDRIAGSDIEIVDLAPGSVDAPRLSGLDAAAVTTPELLDAEAWRRLRGFADAGGLVLVSPPAGATVHLWTDAMLDAFDLQWTVAREATEFETPRRLGDRGGALLALLDAEFETLARPVGVSRLLTTEGADQIELALDDGSPVAVSGTPGSGRGRLVLFCSALDLTWTDLPTKPLALPLLQELVRQGVGSGRWSGVAGSYAPAPARSAELRSFAGGSTHRVVDARSADPVRRAGAFRATDRSGATRGTVIVRPDTDASRTGTRTREEISAWLAPLGEIRWLESTDTTAQNGDAGESTLEDRAQSPLSLFVLIGVAALALFEAAFARWTSHAYADRGRA